MKHFFPKGRPVDGLRADEIRNLLENAVSQPDLLIENLHRVQDHYGFLDKDTIAGLADVMRLSQSQVFEVASFYAHFHLDHPAPITKACVSLTCAIKRKGPIDPNAEPVPCVGQCAQAPVDFSSDSPIRLPDYIPFEKYTYDVYKNVKGKTDFILSELENSGLRGLGGAGFPVARKWRFLCDATDDTVLVVNADEGEPGTFKDKYCLETNPHKMLEGMLIAADVIKATDIYIYLRDEYVTIREILLIELEKLRRSDILHGHTIHLRRGAGAYICGEETALLESIEGKRGLPRIKPPYPAQYGLFGRPTLINNVETLWRVQEVLELGPLSASKRFYSVSGRVKNPGVYEASTNVTVRTLINEYAGGMVDGHTFKAYLPGGASGGILPAHMDDLPLSFGSLEKHGCFIGSAAVIILSDQDNMKEVVKNLISFFEDESCGQCTPCRVGCEKMSQLLEKEELDQDLLIELSDVMQSSSICGLGQAAPNPLRSALLHFAEDFV
jgi:formate dehydrogenase beta subunit